MSSICDVEYTYHDSMYAHLHTNLSIDTMPSQHKHLVQTLRVQFYICIKVLQPQAKKQLLIALLHSIIRLVPTTPKPQFENAVKQILKAAKIRVIPMWKEYEGTKVKENLEWMRLGGKFWACGVTMNKTDRKKQTNFYLLLVTHRKWRTHHLLQTNHHHEQNSTQYIWRARSCCNTYCCGK